MGIIELIVVIFLSITLLNLLYLKIYCVIAEKRDRKKFHNKNIQVSETAASSNTNENNQRFLKNIFRSIQPYMYGWMRYNVICVGKIPSHRIRKLLYKYIFGMKITRSTVIYGGCEIRSPWNITADRCVISTYCILDGRNKILFGEDVVLGGGVHIWTEEHNYNDKYFRVLDENRAPVIIENRAWICSDSTILPGVRVGEGAVIATRACLTKNAEAFGVYAGIPAKKIGQRNTEIDYTLDGKPTWHFY